MKVLKWLDENAELFVMSILMLLITVVMFLQVVMRYALNSALPWPEEVCRYAFIWLSYLGISYSVKDGSMMKVDIVHTLIPKTAPFLNALGDAATFIFMVLMIRPGFETVAKIRRMGTVSAAIAFPMWIVYLSLALGVTLGVFRMVQRYVLIVLWRRSAGRDKTEG